MNALATSPQRVSEAAGALVLIETIAPAPSLFATTPLPEVTELPADAGWSQWDLAVHIQDGPTWRLA